MVSVCSKILKGYCLKKKHLDKNAGFLLLDAICVTGDSAISSILSN
jgi:hypothetical protein